MSERFRLELRRQLKIHAGNLAEDAQALLERYPIYKRKHDMEENQIRNALNAIEQTRSVSALIAFIQYQIARSDKKKKWRFAPDDESNCFGDALIEELEKLWDQTRVSVQSIVRTLAERKVNVEFGEMQEIQWHLARLYLGYLNWYFIYRKKELEQNENAEG
jgi:hypothetical protein